LCAVISVDNFSDTAQRKNDFPQIGDTAHRGLFPK
jgi:hypothetical protein